MMHDWEDGEFIGRMSDYFALWIYSNLIEFEILNLSLWNFLRTSVNFFY